MEAERPCCYREYCNTDEGLWEQLGMRIKWTEPAVPGESTIPMLEPLKLRACLECKKPIPIRYASAAAWTCTFHKDNPEGIWREIPLPYDVTSRKWDDNGVTTYEFAAFFYPTHTDEFRLTFNVKFNDELIWANQFQVDHLLTVTPSKEVNPWTKVESQSQITNNLYIGNYLAVLLAEELGYNAVLNLHKATNKKSGTVVGVEEPLHKNIVSIYKSTDVEVGAGHQIPTHKITDIVDWMGTANRNYKRVLVGDREGQGRSGSAMTAYIFAKNPNLTFQEAYNYVLNRRFIYAHKGLKDTLYQCYPRD